MGPGILIHHASIVRLSVSLTLRLQLCLGTCVFSIIPCAHPHLALVFLCSSESIHPTYAFRNLILFSNRSSSGTQWQTIRHDRPDCGYLGGSGHVLVSSVQRALAEDKEGCAEGPAALGSGRDRVIYRAHCQCALQGG